MLSAHSFAACGSDSLGTSRTIEVDASRDLHIQGTEPSLGLRNREVILTFDDGPIAGKTSRILDELKKECVKATFFWVGRMAKYQPKLVRRAVAEGHTLAHHTHNHENLPKYSTQKASKLIDQGISTLQKIAYNDESSTPRVPFFRYPYLAQNKRTDRVLRQKGLVAFGANIDSLDWKKSSADAVHRRIMRKLGKAGKGIILMHDIQGRTVKMLPRLLRSLKSGGYKVVHMVPAGAARPQEEPVLVAAADPKDFAIPDDVPVALASLSVDVKGSEKKPENPVRKSKQPKERIETDRATQRLSTDEPKSPAEKRSPVAESSEVAIRKERTGVVGTTASDQDDVVASIVPKPVGSPVENLAKVQLKQEKLSVSTKRRLKIARKKPSLVVLAGNRRKGVVKTGKWQLRRSQWILR